LSSSSGRAACSDRCDGYEFRQKPPPRPHRRFCLAAIAAVVPLFVKDVYVQNIMVLTLMWGALSQSWNILSGYCGQISLGHALYFGIGAYTTALLFTKFGVLPVVRA
jgi:ABC-type branched-subunit amino acid transport system permease subunit